MCHPVCIIPWIRDQPNDGKFLLWGGECHRELLARVASEGPWEVGAEKDSNSTGWLLNTYWLTPTVSANVNKCCTNSISCDLSYITWTFEISASQNFPIHRCLAKWQLHLCLSQQAHDSLSLSLSFSVPFHFKLKRIVVLHGNLVDVGSARRISSSG